MARLGPIMVRLGFILAFVYVWYLITSTPSEESSVLLDDANSDLQMQAILSKLEDDSLVPEPKDVQTIYPSVPDKGASGVDRVAAERPSEQIEATLKQVDESDTKSKDEQDSALRNTEGIQNKIEEEHSASRNTEGIQNKIEEEHSASRNMEEGLQDKINEGHITSRILNVGEVVIVTENVNSALESVSPPEFDPDIAVFKHAQHKSDVLPHITDFKEIVDQSSPGYREVVGENPTIGNNQEANESQTIYGNEIDGNIVEPPSDLDTQHEPGRGPCPSGDVLTIIGGGRLANCIWEYATVLSLSRFLPGRRTPYVQKFIIDSLANIFDNLTLPVVEDIPNDCKCCENINWYQPNIHIYSFIPLQKAVKKFKGVHGSLILPKYSLLVEPVMADRKNLMQEMKFKNEVHDAARNTIRRSTEAFYQKNDVGEASVTYVGVHIRRTDYLPYLAEHYNLTEAAKSDYFATAMDYFRQRPDLGVPIFLVVSDDVPWVEANVLGKTDVFSVSDGGIGNPGHDLAVLCYCNHSIIDYGTYGLWGALYAGGETVSIKTSNQVYQVLGRQKNWHFVNLDSNKPEIW